MLDILDLSIVEAHNTRQSDPDNPMKKKKDSEGRKVAYTRIEA
jgi:hypothetical protein